MASSSSSSSFQPPKKVRKRAFICSCLSSVVLLSAGFLIATAAFVLTDYRQVCFTENPAASYI